MSTSWLSKYKLNIDPQYIKLSLYSIIVSLIFISFLSPATYNIGPFMIELSLHLIDHGLTTVDFSPVGEVSARTHLPPLKLNVVFESMDLDGVADLLATTSSQQTELAEKFETQINNIVRSFIIKLLALSTIGGLVGAFIGGYKTPKMIGLGCLIAVVFTGILLSVTFSTFDVNAFENPEYDGILEGFPWMMGVVEDSLTAFDDVSAQLENLSQNLFMFFQRVEDLQGTDFIDGSYRILHISDIHNNPASYNLVSKMAENFQVDMIIDTGDITDYGSPIEAELASRVEEMEVPYVLIPGNHDAPEVTERLSQIPEVYTFDKEQIVSISDFNIAAIPDPASKLTAMSVPREEILDEYASDLTKKIESNEQSPHIIGAHHPRIANQLQNEANVILTGHTHKPKIEIIDDKTIVSNAGTTGAAGIRGLEAGSNIPYSMAVIHFNEKRNPIAVDLITVRHLEAGYRIERFVVSEFLR